MSTENAAYSPKFKNLCYKHKQSPKEFKDKMRKNYKDKVKNCRDMLLDRFRGPVVEEDLCTTLTDIYKSMFKHSKHYESDEIEALDELKNELVQEELEWWLREYEKSQLDTVDWSMVEEEDSVICPVCQKSNFILQNNSISCANCKYSIKTVRSLIDIRKSIMSSLETHNAACSYMPQFTIISEAKEAHIYLICDNCTEMNMVL